MIFPNFAIWLARNDARNAGDQIDRSLESRQRRLTSGISVTNDFSKIHGCLLVTQGRGKFIRFCHATSAKQRVADSTRDACRDLCRNASTDIHQWQLATRDLADEISQTIDQLKIDAGKYVDRILAVGVHTPGKWATDIDGSRIYQGFSDAARVAESTGVNVIDNFAARDLAVGGAGEPLWPLPSWLLLGDRSSPVASTTRLLLVPQLERHKKTHTASSNSSVQVAELELPPSDGLDATLPKLKLSTQTIDSWLSTFRQRDFRDVELIVSGPTDFWIKMKEQVEPRLKVAHLESIVGTGVHFDALNSAMLGLMHIDQMPANMKNATGANCQRILGRLTPGSATNWRNLIIAMAQHHPAPMKLRDAI